MISEVFFCKTNGWAFDEFSMKPPVLGRRLDFHSRP